MHRWADIICRRNWLWVLAWPLAAVAVWAAAPSISMLLADDATGFLPPSMPSQEGFALLRREFPDAAPASSAIVIWERLSGLTADDRSDLLDLSRRLAEQSEELGWRIRSSSLDPLLARFLESSNGHAAMIVVELPAALLTHSTVRRVRIVQNLVDVFRPTDGALVHVTGSGALGELLDRHAKRDVDATTFWAFTAVAVILLMVYRSPIAMLLPVITIGCSIMVAVGALGLAAEQGLPINGLVEMFVIVILAGSGVDYCLFLFSRFQEATARGAEVMDAVRESVARTGPAIIASAGTNVAGLACLALGQNRDLTTSGPTIAVAICVATLAVLTLTPSLMIWVGKYLTWPSRSRPARSAVWESIGRLVRRRPLLVTATVSLALAVPAIQGLGVTPNYDSYEEFPQDSAFVQGARSYEAHFASTLGKNHQTLVMATGRDLRDPELFEVLRHSLDRLAQMLAADFPLAYLRDWVDPLGGTRKIGTANSGETMTLAQRLASVLARSVYVSEGGTAMRVDFGLHSDPRTSPSLDDVSRIRQLAASALQPLADSLGDQSLTIALTGESPVYADMRSVRERDMRVVACAAVITISVIVFFLVRSWLYTGVMVAATILTYLATYGLTWIFFRWAFGVESVSYQLNFLLFIIILSLGQDYNIFVVSRIREERKTCVIDEAVSRAVAATGKVVSSCGLIMAAAFASMYSGSLLLMKEFGFALCLGILIDTFLVRPLLLPSMLLLISRVRGERRPIAATAAARAKRPLRGNSK